MAIAQQHDQQDGNNGNFAEVSHKCLCRFGWRAGDVSPLTAAILPSAALSRDWRPVLAGDLKKQTVVGEVADDRLERASTGGCRNEDRTHTRPIMAVLPRLFESHDIESGRKRVRFRCSRRQDRHRQQAVRNRRLSHVQTALRLGRVGRPAGPGVENVAVSFSSVAKILDVRAARGHPGVLQKNGRIPLFGKERIANSDRPSALPVVIPRGIQAALSAVDEKLVDSSSWRACAA